MLHLLSRYSAAAGRPPTAQRLTWALLAAALCSAGALAEDSIGSRLKNALGGSDGGPGTLFSHQDEFLDPEVAFVLDVTQGADRTLRVGWQVAPGYYLYRDKFKFAAQPASVALGEAQFPDGEMEEDPEFGSVEIYRGQGEASVPVLVAPEPDTPLVVSVRYQGCAQDGICYPPMSKDFPLTWTAGAPGVAAAPQGGAATAVAAQDRVAGLLTAASVWVVGLSFFGFGLLLAFTPCVLPMVPILSGILVGQGERLTPRWALMVSLVYVVAMAVVYAAAGLVAGFFGQNLQALFQDPWVLGVFSAVFVLLALSMFGFYELQLPSSWQTRLAEAGQRQAGGTLRGAAVMGGLSALIVGPCVAPPLAGALIYIGQSGDGLLGGTALFAMGLGMGFPLVIVGASAGHLLPRAGPWMEAVKAVFGVMLLGVAIWLLGRFLPEAVTLMLWAALVIVCAVYMGALDALTPPVSGWRRLWKGLGLVLLVYGAALVVGASSGGRDLTRPLSHLMAGSGRQASAPALAFQPVQGPGGLQQALTAVGSRPVLLDFYADWCVECKQMQRETFADAAVRDVLADFVLLKADVTDYDAQDRALLQELQLYGPPAILFFADARELTDYRLIGFVGPEQFQDHLLRVRQL